MILAPIGHHCVGKVHLSDHGRGEFMLLFIPPTETGTHLAYFQPIHRDDNIGLITSWWEIQKPPFSLSTESGIVDLSELGGKKLRLPFSLSTESGIVSY